MGHTCNYALYYIPICIAFLEKTHIITLIATTTTDTINTTATTTNTAATTAAAITGSILLVSISQRHIQNH